MSSSNLLSFPDLDVELRRLAHREKRAALLARVAKRAAVKGRRHVTFPLTERPDEGERCVAVRAILRSPKSFV
jgi:hypothetical protein